jgi:hypothetical protein
MFRQEAPEGRCQGEELALTAHFSARFEASAGVMVGAKTSQLTHRHGYGGSQLETPEGDQESEHYEHAGSFALSF